MIAADFPSLSSEQFSPYAVQLLQEVLPSLEELPEVHRLMDEAQAKGMTVTEGLEYVLERWSAIS